MKPLLTLAFLSFAACSHHEPAPAAPTTVSTTDPDEPAVDPTLPSWAPRSCRGYHRAVLHVLDCAQIEPTQRAAIKAQYDLDHATWQAMHDEPLDEIARWADSCQTTWTRLRATYDAAQCIPQAHPEQSPTASTP